LTSLFFFDELIVFKGGTALRKLFAGAEGRFSTDFDFALFDKDEKLEEVTDLIASELDVSLGPFDFTPEKKRGRWYIDVESDFGNPAVSIKLDIGPPCWLEPEERSFVEMPIHKRYGWTLPYIPCMRLEELIAEKIARLTRMSTARDAWDLVWIMTTSPYSNFKRELVREMSLLKVWVDNNGLGPAWDKSLAPKLFDPEIWLSSREDWDKDQIGLLTPRSCSMKKLESDLIRLYSWMAKLNPVQRQFARADERDRSEVMKAISELDGSRFQMNEMW
jgi:predicted nucleotidyltransferase component of viral defense system